MFTKFPRFYVLYLDYWDTMFDEVRTLEGVASHKIEHIPDRSCGPVSRHTTIPS